MDWIHAGAQQNQDKLEKKIDYFYPKLVQTFWMMNDVFFKTRLAEWKPFSRGLYGGPAMEKMANAVLKKFLSMGIAAILSEPSYLCDETQTR